MSDVEDWSRAVITGTRDPIWAWIQLNMLDSVVRALAEAGCRCIAEGGATGVDRHVQRLCREYGIERVTYKANWKRYGSLAGPMRNEYMVKDFLPTVGFAFEGGNGTANCFREMRRAHVPVAVVNRWRIVEWCT